MRLNRVGVIATLVCVCTASASGVVGASAAGPHRARTKVTIAVWPDGVFGYVQSSNPSCEQGRRIVIFREGHPGAPANKVETESATRNQVGYEWLAPVSRAHGYFAYGVAEATPGCAAATSRTISVSTQSLPHCPDVSGGKCVLVIHWLECPTDSFSPASGTCNGRTTEGPVYNYWGSNTTYFRWKPHTSKNERVVTYESPPNSRTDFDPFDAKIEGDVPNDRSPRFAIGYAVSQLWGYLRTFNTPNREGVAPGADGGPLYLNFDGGNLSRSTHIIIWGTLYMSRCIQHGCP